MSEENWLLGLEDTWNFYYYLLQNSNMNSLSDVTAKNVRKSQASTAIIEYPPQKVAAPAHIFRRVGF